MIDHISICWVVAMKSEAFAICKCFNLKNVTHEGPFPIFTDLARRHWLAISGVGRVQAAAATMYLHDISGAQPWAVWVNLGIAGHGRADYGTLFLVDKIVEKSTGRKLYPRPLISSNVSRSVLETVDQPDTNYKSGTLFDMEGAAFFDIACRLSCQQLVLLLKIVSDGPNAKLEGLTDKKIIQLIEQNISSIKKIIKEMEGKSKIEYNRLVEPQDYKIIIKKWHFSKTRRTQLQVFLRKWDTVFPKKDVVSYVEDCSNSNMVLKKISLKLNTYKIEWDKR